MNLTHMHKQRRLGAGLLLVIEVVIGVVGLVFFFRYYHMLTVKAGTVEETIDLHQPIGLSLAHVQDTGSTIAYDGLFGKLVAMNVQSTGTIFDYRTDTKEIVKLDAQKIYIAHVIQRLLEQKRIDASLAQYLLHHQSPDKVFRHLIMLSKYFPSALVSDDLLSQDVLFPYQALIESKQYKKLTLALQNLALFLVPLMKQTTTTPTVSAPFLATESFQYLKEKFLVDHAKKYTDHIKRVATIFNINPNLIRAAILGEQVRGFFTYRGVAKQILRDNFAIMSMGQGSYGIGGIKIETAQKVERRIQKQYPDIYQNYFTYSDGDKTLTVLYQRLSDTQSYFYQVLYAGALIREILDRWDHAGFAIDDEPGVILTLYNIGDNKSPHAHPQIGGASIDILGQKYTFGSLAMLLYYWLEVNEW